MKKHIGIWIDHRKAVMVTVEGDSEVISQLDSNMEKHVRYSQPDTEGPGENQRDRQYMAHLDSYYDRVIEIIKDTASLLIMGPGEAKKEFVKRLQHNSFKGRIVGVETTDKMTDRQIAARVREEFLVKV